jgi:hypothetical protein
MRKLFLLALAIGSALLNLPLAASAAESAPQGFIRGSGPTVYWLAQDGKRYVFPNEATLQSWLTQQETTGQVVSDAVLAQHPIGGNMTMRPGSVLVRFDSDPTVYVVTRGGVLRSATAQLAEAFYGPGWAQRIEMVSVALFTNYRLGAPLMYTSDISLAAEAAAASTPDMDIRLKQTSGLLPRSTSIQLNGTVTFTASRLVVQPAEAPATVELVAKVEKTNSPIANLTIQIFDEKDRLQKTCISSDICKETMDFSMMFNGADKRYYAVVSNEKGEKLGRIYTPYITIQPFQAPVESPLELPTGLPM